MSTEQQDWAARRQASKRARKKNTVLTYLVILFAVAFLLLLLSFFSQQRANEAAIDNLEQTSNSAVQTLDNIIAERDTLKTENEALQQALEEAKTAAEQSNEEQSLAMQRLNALHTLNNIRALYNQGKYQEARNLIGQNTMLEYYLEEYSQNYLSEEGRAIYDPLEAYQNMKKWLS